MWVFWIDFKTCWVAYLHSIHHGAQGEKGDKRDTGGKEADTEEEDFESPHDYYDKGHILNFKKEKKCCT